MRKVIALLFVCLFLSGCACMFGSKETGADKRPEEGYKQPVGGYRTAEDVASGTTKEERAFGLR